MKPTLPEISARHWDFVIVGAGPAGALAAGLLASSGHSVLLLDRAAFPRDKVCGGCLNASAIASLQSAGLADILPQLHASPIHSLHIAIGGTSADFDLPSGSAVSRRAFDSALVNAAVCRGAVFADATAACPLPPTAPKARTLSLQSGGEQSRVSASIILACDGLRGSLLDAEPGCQWRIARHSRIGVWAMVNHGHDDYAPGLIHMAVARHGYVGAVRVEDGRLNVAAALDPAACRSAGGPQFLVRQILGSAHLPVPDLSRMAGTGLLTRRRPRLGAHRILAIGDAAGYVEPFTGEGMAWALAGAHAAVPFALRGLTGWSDHIIDQWTAAHAQLLATRRLSCRAITQCLRSPLLAAAALRVAGFLPAVAGGIIHAVNRPTPLPRQVPCPEPA